jgi:hypothetical protein
MIDKVKINKISVFNFKSSVQNEKTPVLLYYIEHDLKSNMSYT